MNILDKKIKATLLIENQFGFVVSRHVWLHRYGWRKRQFEFEPKLEAVYVLKGKRKRMGFRFDKCVIAHGWQDIKGTFNNPAEGQNEFLGFDTDEFTRLAAKVTDVIEKSKF